MQFIKLQLGTQAENNTIFAQAVMKFALLILQRMFFGRGLRLGQRQTHQKSYHKVFKTIKLERKKSTKLKYIEIQRLAASLI